VFELDLKEEEEVLTEEQKKQEASERQRKNNCFHLNIIDFSLFKLRSAVFFLQFPVT
jgi:hypothetical protein